MICTYGARGLQIKWSSHNNFWCWSCVSLIHHATVPWFAKKFWSFLGRSQKKVVSSPWKKTPQGHKDTTQRFQNYPTFFFVLFLISKAAFFKRINFESLTGSTLKPFRVAGALPFCIDRSLERLAYRIEERYLEDFWLGSLQSSPHEKKGSHDLNQTSEGIMCKAVHLQI